MPRPGAFAPRTWIRQLLALGARRMSTIGTFFMVRLTIVFLVWMASTAYALDDADADYDAELHEAYGLAWSESDAPRRRLLARAQRGWSEYRAANCELLGDQCHALMAQERAAELRALVDKYERSYYYASDAERGPTHLSRYLSRHQR
jgi:hypothetical protein